MVEAVDSPSLFEWNLWRDFEFCPLQNFGFAFYKKESGFFLFSCLAMLVNLWEKKQF